MSARGWRWAATRALLVGASLLLGLAIFEVGVRILRTDGATPVPSETPWVFCVDRHHRLVPNAHSLHEAYEFRYVWENNALGMRDRPRSEEKPPGTFRILFLGDSFIQGHGVALEDGITQVLEKRFAAGSAAPVEVLNAGVFGYSPLLENIYLHQLIDRLTPDLVLLGLFLGNDVGEDRFYESKAEGDPLSGPSFHDSEWPWTAIVQELEGASREEDTGKRAQEENPSADAPPAPPSSMLQRAQRALVQNLVSLQLVRGALARSREGKEYRERREWEFALVAKSRADEDLDLGLVNYDVRTREDRLRLWATTKRYLHAMSSLCRERGVGFGLVVIPPVERLDGTTDFSEPYDELESLGEEEDVPVIQLLDAFLQGDPYDLYYRYDRHWTPAGHRLAAEVLEAELIRRRLVPPGGP